ncbi:MAG: hypothetical protein GQ569_13180 [Methylococcaceae bacterium]|nr:hypothetical protein [Methylococcaceae bacterium]
MTRIDRLKIIFAESSLSEFFTIKKEDDYPDKKYSSLRFNFNEYRFYAIEIFESSDDGEIFRIYHSNKIAVELKSELDQLQETFHSHKTCADFKGSFDDYKKLSKKLHELLSNDGVIEAVRKNLVFAQNNAYEGLELPDIDVSDAEIKGRVFTWKELIAINEDTSDDNKLKQELSQCGVYLQRSLDGKSRYVGSAYGEGGILARWTKHLTSNGHAKHLNLFVLENGYNNICFTVLELTKKDDVLDAESRWKFILGSKNAGAYDGFRLNSN